MTHFLLPFFQETVSALVTQVVMHHEEARLGKSGSYRYHESINTANTPIPKNRKKCDVGTSQHSLF